MDASDLKHQKPRSLRIVVVTETYLPEINGVAMTMGQVVNGLLNRGHRIELVRPRQYATEVPRAYARFEEVLLRGVPIRRGAMGHVPSDVEKPR